MSWAPPPAFPGAPGQPPYPGLPPPAGFPPGAPPPPGYMVPPPGAMPPYPGAPPPGYWPGMVPPPVQIDPRDLSTTAVHVSGLPYTPNEDGTGGTPLVDEAHLHNLFFSSCGPIRRTTMAPEGGSATIEFETQQAAGSALAMDQQTVLLQPENPSSWAQLHVCYALKKDLGRRKEPGNASGGKKEKRSPSPMRRPRFTETEARRVKELLKTSVDDGELVDCYDLVAYWLQHGECSKRSADSFYTLIQATHARAKSMAAAKENRDKLRREEDVQWAESVGAQYRSIEKLFEEAGKQRVSDVMSKQQRKQVGEMRQATEVAMKKQLAALVETRPEEDMDTTNDAGGEGRMIMERAKAFAAKMAAAQSPSGPDAKRVKTEGQPPPPAYPPPPPGDPPPGPKAGGTAAVCAALAVFLSSQPAGATVADMKSYLCKLSRSKAGGKEMRATQAVKAALKAYSPEVFTVGEDGSADDEETLWYFAGFDTVKALLAGK